MGQNKFHISNLYFIFILYLNPFISAFSQTEQITILHTNDMHTQFIPIQATWIHKDSKPLIGSMVALKYFVDQERIKNSNVMVLDAGDMMTGTPLSNIEAEGVIGGGFITMMNRIGYDACTIGNHEFDNGIANLKKLFNLAQFEVLSANLFLEDSLFAMKKYEIVQVGNLKIGIVGLILDDLFGVVSKTNLQGIIVKPVVETAQDLIDEIDPQTDLIILLTHQGFARDSLLAASVHGADVIVGGHSHTRLFKPRYINDIIVVQAGDKAQYLGKLVLRVNNDHVIHYEGELLPLWTNEVKEPDSAMIRMVSMYENQINQEFKVEIGILKTAWETSNYWEANLGDFITDAMRAFTKTDFALLNSGGIRKRLEPGPITKLDIVEILPFSNYLVKFTCSGEQLLTFIKENAQASANRAHGIMQVSGLEYSYRIGSDNRIEIVSALINGEPILSDKEYTGVSVDFVLIGQEMKYLMFRPENLVNLGIVVADVVVNYVKVNPVVDLPLQHRIHLIQ